MNDVEPVVEKIFRVALEWCEMNPGWKRICDIPNTDSFYKTWDELPKSTRAAWGNRYHEYAERAWREFGQSECKIPYGFVGTDGVFYPQITDVPINTNHCMVFKVGNESRKEQP